MITLITFDMVQCVYRKSTKDQQWIVSDEFRGIFFSQHQSAKHRVPTSLVPRLLLSIVIIFFNHLDLKNALPLSLWSTVGIRMNNQSKL